MNLFEKYGIKEVADVTFYKIERKNEMYEAQREIAVSSILKNSVSLQTVYPMDENGLGIEEGMEAYVFTNADILTGTEYENHTEVEGDAGSHEYSYEEQVLILFSKNQNLIKKTGVRYKFEEENLFGNLVFNDEFAATPNSSEKVVVLGLAGSFDVNTYSVEDINASIAELTTTYKAKAYNVVYKNYAELVVDDEMGYYNPNFLGTTVDKTLGTIEGSYAAEDTPLAKGKDLALAGSVQWVDGEGCLSINDAIDALKKKKQTLDVATESNAAGFASVSGGYPISDDLAINGTDDAGVYTYSVDPDTDPTTLGTSGYALNAVLDALAEISLTGEAIEEDIIISDNDEPSNRAIYVRTDGALDMSASSYIYVMKNINNRKLASDTAGIFSFSDKKGNTVYYKDEIFAGVEYLALVIIGNKGLIFKVARNGVKKIEKVGWVINENGYVTDAQAARLVENGLIHTTNITINDESFDATCEVSGLTVRKTPKLVNRYVPVLFLDTLKVSTIEQTAEQTSANGGRGNGQLIIWDYNKEITITLEDALYSPASMSATLGSYEGNDFTKGVKTTKRIDRMEPCVAPRSFIVPAGNSDGTPSEGESSPQAVYIEKATMQPYQDGSPIAEGESYLKWTRSVAYGDNSLGNTIEISADKFPGTYMIVGDTFSRNKETGEDQRFQFCIPQAKMGTEQSITLAAEGDPTVFNLNMTVLRPDDGVMVKLTQYDVVENTEENDGSTMIKGTENLNLLDNAEMFKVNSDVTDEITFIGATEY